MRTQFSCSIQQEIADSHSNRVMAELQLEHKRNKNHDTKKATFENLRWTRCPRPETKRN